MKGGRNKEEGKTNEIMRALRELVGMGLVGCSRAEDDLGVYGET